MSSKRTRMVLTYRPNPDELFQASLEVRDDYPDCIATVRAELVRGIRDTMTEALAQYDKADKPNE